MDVAVEKIKDPKDNWFLYKKVNSLILIQVLCVHFINMNNCALYTLYIYHNKNINFLNTYILYEIYNKKISLKNVKWEWMRSINWRK